MPRSVPLPSPPSHSDGSLVHSHVSEEKDRERKSTYRTGTLEWLEEIQPCRFPLLCASDGGCVCFSNTSIQIKGRGPINWSADWVVLYFPSPLPPPRSHSPALVCFSPADGAARLLIGFGVGGSFPPPPPPLFFFFWFEGGRDGVSRKGPFRASLPFSLFAESRVPTAPMEVIKHDDKDNKHKDKDTPSERGAICEFGIVTPNGERH